MTRPSIRSPRGVAALTALLLGVAGLLVAGPSTGAAPAKQATAAWTFMIYDSADNNIAGDLIGNLAKLTRLAPMANVNVVALVDLPEKDDPGYPSQTLPGIAPFTTAKLVVLKGSRYQEIRDLGEISMGRPDTLASFIAEAADRFPAQHYGLSLTDHGGAYYGAMSDDGPPGSRMMSLADLRDGINAGLQRAKVKRLDLIDQDSCLMSSYEANTVLGPLARTIVGSEESTFTDNTMAPQAVAALTSDPGTGRVFAAAQTQGYADYIEQAYPDGAAFTAMSAVDGDAMKRVDDAVSAFATVAAAHMAEIAPAVARARADALEFEAALEGEETNPDWDVVDLGDFLRHLDGLPAEVQVARDAAFAAIQQATFSLVTGSAATQATGLNVHLPSKANGYFSTYLKTAPPAWAGFVKAYVGAGKTPPTTGSGAATFTSDTADVLQDDATGIKIGGQLASGNEANVVSATSEVYPTLAGQRFLALVEPAYLNAGAAGAVQGVWNFAVTALTDGTVRSPATVVYQAEPAGLIGTFAASYTPPKGPSRDVRFRVLLASDGSIQGYTVTDNSDSQNTAGVTLEPGGTVAPYLRADTGSGFTDLPGKPVTVSATFGVGFAKVKKGAKFDMFVVVKGKDGKESAAGVSSQTR
ncbi:MAG: Clostripain [Nocardioidaceae bacterium]|nr:Clostripain [Nocardioidaceae bacterium]